VRVSDGTDDSDATRFRISVMGELSVASWSTRGGETGGVELNPMSAAEAVVGLGVAFAEALGGDRARDERTPGLSSRVEDGCCCASICALAAAAARAIDREG
jgi:hypothetical protein